jgi:GTPase SAR1 family protein
MVETKKIVFVGPPNTGKTTIKSVFFEMANPVKLLKDSLDPTRGVISTIYSLFDLELGIFDLAGQENENWFTKEQDIFNHTNLIICVLDINRYLKDNFAFIDDLIKIYKELKLSFCTIVILLHKIDLMEPLYVQHKFKAFDEYIKNEKKCDFRVQIYSTSITKKFFLQTYDIITEIFSNSIKDISSSKTDSLFQDFRVDLNIILQYDDMKSHNIKELFYDFDLSIKEATPRLRRLERLGFLKFVENLQNFQLTERANFFKKGLEAEERNEKENKINRILESLYLFSNLNKE